MTLVKREQPRCSRKRWLHLGFVRLECHKDLHKPIKVGVWAHVGSTMYSVLPDPLAEEMRCPAKPLQ